MNREKKKSLLGEIGKIHATYEHDVPVKKLNLPLEPGAVIRVFCQGCGTTFGLNEEDARGLYELLAYKTLGEKPKTFLGHYFETGVCPFCNGEQNNVRIKPIPSEED
ncbi:hypothetical protein COT98_03240 [Candidatus Falkowbacteria bacterium CG10_big_fil_rev_8_21_14_0_10_39_9]|uniref:Uncharacterized protein n=1 Tax=Candidatus Falkowbacteria bacterium CG10_big_fil_rev_8_21_14_0_10_39_9 TaxID=1974566 RepID=A0A2M6WNY3_9BACT|nr:MAG: hypothetical protein COT98_03240 [Candidatus Falkowbacteria bacterium CG10_big_fil_rev_8_21_14_0_10_39_9]